MIPSSSSRPEQPVAAHRLVGGGDDSSEPSSSPAKTTWTTCFDQRLRSGEIDSTIATGPSTGSSSYSPHEARLLGELAVERLDERLAAPHAAAREQPVLAAALLVAAEEDRAVPAEQGGDADPRLRVASGPGRAEASSPRSLGGSSSTSTSSTEGSSTIDELRDPHPGLDDERLCPVGVQQDHLHLAAVALVDEPGGVHLPEPVARGEPRPRHHEARVARRDRDREPGPDDRPGAGAISTRSHEARSSPASAAYAWPGSCASARAASGNSRLQGDRPSRGGGALRLDPRDEVAGEPPHVACGSRARTRTPSSVSGRSSIGAPSA